MSDELAARKCRPCHGGVPPLDADEAKEMLGRLHNDWSIADDGKSLIREFGFDDFASALRFAVAVGEIADAEDHHPDLEIGWGRCRITWTTHAIDGLSENDFICAAKVDALDGNGG